MELSHKLDTAYHGLDSYDVIRYRDDYKILTNNPQLGRTIVKELSSILSNWGLKLNTAKTKMNVDPVLASVKSDKIYELHMPDHKMSFSKKLLQIYSASNQFPNSGLVVRQLSHYFDIIENLKRLEVYDDPVVMLGIVTNLAIRNPRAYPWCTAIMGHILSFCPEESRLGIIKDIHAKFDDIPNTGLLDVWLQRVSYTIDPSIPFKEPLAQIASGQLVQNTIWDSSWLRQDVRDVVMNTTLLNQMRLEEMPMAVPREEVALFRPPIFS